jgi:DNA-directed RNA polymerase subunit RPC12/RpoP
MNRKFQRHIENFICAHCGTEVIGNGYTNHCPQCLYSKHVDINPGDRANGCGGMLQPVGLEQKGDSWNILHQCQKCGAKMRCKTVPEDMAAVLKLAKTLAENSIR